MLAALQIEDSHITMISKVFQVEYFIKTFLHATPTFLMGFPHVDIRKSLQQIDWTIFERVSSIDFVALEHFIKKFLLATPSTF